MMNFWGLFLGFLSSLFHRDLVGRIGKMTDHNTALQVERHKRLRPYAEQFLLPLCSRDKEGRLVDNKMTRKYKAVMEKRRVTNLERRGHKWFNVNGEMILALNLKNAKRKAKWVGEVLIMEKVGV